MLSLANYLHCFVKTDRFTPLQKKKKEIIETIISQAFLCTAEDPYVDAHII